MVKRAESASQTQRYLDEAQAWAEDNPDRAEALAGAGPGRNRYNVRRGGALVAQFAIEHKSGKLTAVRVPDADMDR